jgi:hypothetical protein
LGQREEMFPVTTAHTKRPSALLVGPRGSLNAVRDRLSPLGSPGPQRESMPRRQPQTRWLKRTCPEQTKPVNRVSADDVACGREAAAWGRRDPKIAAEFVPTDRAPLRGSLVTPEVPGSLASKFGRPSSNQHRSYG